MYGVSGTFAEAAEYPVMQEKNAHLIPAVV